MRRVACWAIAFALCASGDAFADHYYTIYINPISSGTIPIAALSFRFHSQNILVPLPQPGGFIDLTQEPGFSYSGEAQPGFNLIGFNLGYPLLDNDRYTDVPFFVASFINSAGDQITLECGDSIVYLIGPNRRNLTSPQATYGNQSLVVTPSMFVPGSQWTSGDIGTGSFSIAPFALPEGQQFCPAAGANERRLNSTLGQVYNPLNQSCANGGVVPLDPPPGDLTCDAGVNGPGGFYDLSNSYCSLGAIVPVGYYVCSAGSYGSGGFYLPAGEGCDHGVVVPPGDEYCQRGPTGGGGLYDPATDYCDLGKIGLNFPGP